MTVSSANRAVRSVLGNPAGQCYVAAEAVYHLAGGERSGFTPCVLRLHRGKWRTHWFLRSHNAVIDPTAAQFASRPAYHRGRGCGFLTKGPSTRARALMAKVRAWRSNAR